MLGFSNLLFSLSLGLAAPDADPTKHQPAEWQFKLLNPAPQLRIEFNDDMRFGLQMIGVPDPRPDRKDEFKQLTFFNTGDSNNTIVKIGNAEHYFGRPVRGVQDWGPGSINKAIKLPNDRLGKMSIMDFKLDKVLIKQHVEIVPSASGLLDTCLIYYTIKNYGDDPKKVGIRILLDTYIGATDGVPFLIPDGRRRSLTTMEEFVQKTMPDYIEAIENPDDVKDHGTVVRVGLKGVRLPRVEYLEDIEKMRICRWPQNKDIRWSWEMEPMDQDPMNKDSCVALYWAWREMKPGEIRQMAFTYGLSNLALGGTKVDGPPDPNETVMAMSVPSNVLLNKKEKGAEFVVTAHLWRTKPGQKVSLVLDRGLTLAAGEAEEKTVNDPGDRRTQVSWKVKATSKGSYQIWATSEKSKTKPRRVEVQE